MNQWKSKNRMKTEKESVEGRVTEAGEGIWPWDSETVTAEHKKPSKVKQKPNQE
jgi:hypothetical protein